MEQDFNLSSRAVATRFGVHVGTIRRWEREGRIPPAMRMNGRRVYSAADVERIKAAIYSTPKREGAVRE